jgi:phosphoserine phosphatase
MKKIFAFILLASCLTAQIIETNRIEDIAPFVDEHTWIIFDIDDTLIESTMQLGTRGWYRQEIDKLKSLGHDEQAANDILSPDLDRVREACPVQTLEPETSPLIQALQKKAAAVFCLTSRYSHASEITIRQLNQVGIDFTPSAPPLYSIPDKGIHYEKGILLNSPHNEKGKTIRQFIERMEKPSRIIFVDDTMKHLIDMENEMAEEGIPCFTFLYTRCLERTYDPQVAAREYSELFLQ